MPTNSYIGIISNRYMQAVAKFGASGGTVEQVTGTGQHSQYAVDKDTNRPVIYLNTDEIASTARTTGVSYDQAYAQVLVHEMGHFMEKNLDSYLFNPSASGMTAEQACYAREVATAVWGQLVAAETRSSGGALSVQGVAGVNDLFTRVANEMSKLDAQGLANTGSLDPANPLFLQAIKDLSINYQNDPGYRAFCQSIDKKLGAPFVPPDLPDDLFDTGCVEVGSFLPCGRRAGDIKEGDEMILGDENTFELSTGIVSYSERKTVTGYEITTENDVSLVCSGSAPIPTRTGYVLAPDLLGEKVPVYRVDQEQRLMQWENVVSVKNIGEIEIQHITVGNRCFWAGKKQGVYILHHNQKNQPVFGEMARINGKTAQHGTLHFDQFGLPIEHVNATIIGLAQGTHMIS